jgi:multiple sugar transport system substrate-binding protein
MTITIWNPEDTPGADSSLAAYAKGFEALHPNVTVQVTTIPWGNIYTKWEAAIQSGTTPDLSFGSVTYATSFNSEGVLAPLNPVVKALGGDKIWANTAQSIVKMSKDSKGNYFTMPWVNNSVVLWYKKSMLKAAGLQPPKTWAELQSDAAAMTKNGNYGILTPSASADVTDQTLYSLILSNGGDVLNRSNPNQITFNDPKSVQAIQFYKTLSQYSPPGSGGYDRPQAQAAMTTGKLGMFIYGSWMAGALQQAHVFNQFGVTAVPGGPANNGKTGSFMGNMTLMMFKNSKHAAMAQKFAEYMYQTKNYVKWMVTDPGSYLPVLAAAQKSPSYTDNSLVKSEKAVVDAAFAGLPNAWVYGMPSVHAGQFEGVNVIAQAAGDVIDKGESAQQAADAVAQQMKTLIK